MNTTFFSPDQIPVCRGADSKFHHGSLSGMGEPGTRTPCLGYGPRQDHRSWDIGIGTRRADGTNSLLSDFAGAGFEPARGGYEPPGLPLANPAFNQFQKPKRFGRLKKMVRLEASPASDTALPLLPQSSRERETLFRCPTLNKLGIGKRVRRGGFLRTQG